MMPLPHEQEMVCMQMSLSASSNISYFLFKSFTVTNGGTFFLILLFTFASAFVSELSGHLLLTSDSKLNPLVFALLRILQYSQMLMVMTYNIWVILVLIAAQTLFMCLFKNFRNKAKGLTKLNNDEYNY